MDYIIPSSIKKTIKFPRLSSKNVIAYEIYTKTVDVTYESGIRTDLIDTISNPNIPSPVVTERKFDYSENGTWYLPKDIYMDRDHKIRVFVDDIQISSLYYTINKMAGLFTINKNAITINPDSIVKIEYYKDIIEKSYMVEQECEVIVKPKMIESYHYGKHNIIL
jgi:hypothetical protein